VTVAGPPKSLRAATLSEAATRAASSVVALAADSTRFVEAELQLAIFLGAAGGSALFDVLESAGCYEARDARGGELVVRGGTLEALIAAIQAAPGGLGEAATLGWVRPLSAIGADGITTVPGPYPAPRQSQPGRFSRARTVLATMLVVPATLVFLLLLSLSDEGVAWSAHLGEGKAGTWTYTNTACRRTSCVGWGSFASDDGTDIRSRASMYETPQVMQPGESVRAVSIDGNQNSPEGGGSTWLGKLTAAALCLALLGIWSWTVPLSAIRRHQVARSPQT
jgi:hypothetical protein